MLIGNENKPFVILFFERSGSSYLVSLLNKHPEISCKGEIFDADWTKTTQSPPPPTIIDSEKINELLKKTYTTSKPVSGFKFKYPIQYNLYPEVVSFLESNKSDLKIIFLHRLNKLKGAISSQNNLRIIKEMGRSNIPTKSSFKLGKLELNIPKAIQHMKHSIKADKKFYNKVKNYPNILTISYEDLLYNYSNTLDEVFDFLNVKKIPLKSDLKKASFDSIPDAISNFDKVQKRLTCTPFEIFLSPELRTI